MTKKQCIAMLLAGGRGSRLGELTQYIAKPAVPYGGKYRIVDFTLSNCRNSGIDTVGILTQYHPHVLQNYIGNGKHWDLDHKSSGVTLLPPYQCELGERWYEGTAHAIFQNIRYIESYDPEYVLVISGDHIYKMDYKKMLDQHIATNADATISVINVPWSEADRFGIMDVDPNTNRIVEFEEKPKSPKSNLASMGIYIFKWQVLKSYLLKEEENMSSSKDFGKDIIPAMLEEEKNLFAYHFSGYWKDVGTIESYWEANMDLLSTDTNPILQHPEWPIYTADSLQPPMYLDEGGELQQSLVSEGCQIEGRVENSVLFYGVKVGKGAVIKDSVILPNTVIEENTAITRAVIGSSTIIERGVKIGFAQTFGEITLIGDNKRIKKDIGSEIKLNIV
jgi:glucose-1-phosphate adenylyltransferase